jgi:transcriptional regulator with XRE-family HTH domain
MLVENEAAGYAPHPGWMAGDNPEALAGQELQRLRKARGWSQDEAASRMRPYGYTWNQTMISKIESGSRPLRVNELADFADLYGVLVSQLLRPQMSLEEVEAELGGIGPALKEAEARASAAEEVMSAKEGDLKAAKEARDRAVVEMRRLRQRLEYLHGRQDMLSPHKGGSR